MAGDTSRWAGIPDLRQALADLPEKLRKRVLRNGLAAGGRVVRDAAKASAPVLRTSAPYRTPGTVRGAISVRTSKQARREGNVGVFINVRPAKGGAKGAKTGKDPFFWRWQEFGWTPYSGPRKGQAGKANKAERRRSRASGKAGGVQIPGIKFLTNAASKLPQALQVFIAKVGPAIQKLNQGKNAQP